MDGIVLLKEDHKTVEKLFKQFEKAGDDAHADKRKIADQVIEELTTHTWIEEKIFYPAARKAAPDTKDHVLESIEEHHVVLWLLSELKDLAPADERFDAKMTVLMENVRHHVEEEEKEWFPNVRKAMGRNRLTPNSANRWKRPRRKPLVIPSPFPAPTSRPPTAGAPAATEPLIGLPPPSPLPPSARFGFRCPGGARRHASTRPPRAQA
ncbi:Hemerythrin HHE cation binding domain protein [Actinobacteria bacterium OK006]|nr:Hemerythrin HHE cation binding domain protein [Actinobacteria bacterium OK006]